MIVLVRGMCRTCDPTNVKNMGRRLRVDNVALERFGIVRIARNFPSGSGPRFTGYWDRGDPPELLEEGPGWDDLHDAVAWGKARAPRVLVRLGATDDTIYSAGEIRLTHNADGSDTPYPLWP
jgi:hypothetical protein